MNRALLFVTAISGASSLKIACVGDSITAGVTASDPEKTSYPAWLMSRYDGEDEDLRGAKR